LIVWKRKTESSELKNVFLVGKRYLQVKLVLREFYAQFTQLELKMRQADRINKD
jgi:hypothetical protein